MSDKGPYRQYDTNASIKIPRNSAWRWRNQMEELILDKADEVQKEFETMQFGRLIYQTMQLSIVIVSYSVCSNQIQL